MYKQGDGAKTRQKGTQTVNQGMFLHAWSQPKNATCCPRWLLFTDRIKVRNKGEARGALYIQIIKQHGKTRKQAGGAKEKEKQGHTSMSSQEKNAAKNDDTELAKKRSK